MSNFKGKNYINGEWLDSETQYIKINPSTGENLGTFPQSGPTEVSSAIQSARESFHKWKKLSRFVRSNYMDNVAKIIERRKEELSIYISLETGKNYNESVAEVNEALHMAQFAF